MSNDEETLSRRDREKLAHRQDIMDAATRIFAEKGYSNATLEEIAQEAEFSKGTLYLYFSNKEDLLYSIITEKSEKMFENVPVILTGKATLKEELRELFMETAELSFSQQDFARVLMTIQAMDYRPFSEEKVEEFMCRHDNFWEIVLKRVQLAIDRGELRAVEAEAVTGLIHGSLDHMMMAHWGCESLDCLKHAIDHVIDIFFNGIAKERETTGEN